MPFIKVPHGESKPMELPPKGTRAARCYRIIDLGTQPGGQYGPKRKIMFSFELVGTRMKEHEKPFSVHTTMNLSLNEKAQLRAFLLGWRGHDLDESEQQSGVDFEALLDAPCLVQIVHDKDGEKTYANIKTISPPMDGQDVKPLVTPTVMFSLDEPDFVLLGKFTENLQAKIKGSPEYQAAAQRATAMRPPQREPGEDAEEIPGDEF